MEGLQWGRPGPGGAYWRHSALTGQNFFDKMVSIVTEAILQLGDKGAAIHATVSVTQGWCGSADPRKRQYETKHSEADEMRKEIEEIKVKTEVEHKDIMSGEGIELVPLMKDKHTGDQRNISTVTVDM